MTLKQDKVTKLCLESHHTGKLTHFKLDWSKSNWYVMRYEWYRKK